MKKCTNLIQGLPYMLHGGDYNPDQWRNYPGTVERDLELTRNARCNTFSVGIFSWVTYEKQEGVFDFSWLDDLMDRMAKAGNKVLLATPSGARPAWMAKNIRKSAGWMKKVSGSITIAARIIAGLRRFIGKKSGSSTVNLQNVMPVTRHWRHGIYPMNTAARAIAKAVSRHSAVISGRSMAHWMR